jgi:hypothetical protein
MTPATGPWPRRLTCPCSATTTRIELSLKSAAFLKQPGLIP